MLDGLGVMMEGVVEVDKDVDEILMEKMRSPDVNLLSEFDQLYNPLSPSPSASSEQISNMGMSSVF